MTDLKHQLEVAKNHHALSTLPLRRTHHSTRCHAQFTQAKSTRDKILAKLSLGQQRFEDSLALQDLINQLVANPIPDKAAEAFKLGQGTWEVFNAPHIAKLSAVVGAKFTPIRYKLQGKSIVSNVGFSSSLFREGWLSASGTIEASGTNTLHLVFDKYWIDFGLNNLRHELQDSESGLDRVVMALGKLGFIKEFSYFPVLYMDPEGQLAVFSFPPLNSNIAIRRIDK